MNIVEFVLEMKVEQKRIEVEKCHVGRGNGYDVMEMV